MATSVGGVLTGRGADVIIIDDPLKPDEAVSDVRRQNANDWYDHSLLSRLDNKTTGVIVVIMQRLHMDDLVGHVLEQGGWEILKLPAIATEDEEHRIWTPYGTRTHHRKAGVALHPERESLEVLGELRRAAGEYNFAGQYQQDPVPMGGGLVKTHWFQTYNEHTLPRGGEIVQSWDTASKESELASYSVCTTWLVHDKKLYLRDVLRQRMTYPELKRAVKAQAERFKPMAILIEDKSSGIQLIQELRQERLYAVQGIKPEGDKVMRLHAQTPTIENGFVHLPESAPWKLDYLAEITTFPRGKYDDQVDSTSQALAWIKVGMWTSGMGVYQYMKEMAMAAGEGAAGN
jgi:predicted phage terminase large subunit-like protein